MKSGADIIDIRTIPGEDLSKQIPEIIRTVKRVAGNLPVSIDTLNPDEIEVAVKAGADLVLSLDHGNYKEVLPLLEEKNIPAVILPTDYNRGWIPETAEEKVKSLESLKRKCKSIDVIPDPILDPVNSKSIVDSIKACREYTSRNPEPIFFGAGNVAELIDVDSTGVNALLAGMGMELGAGILFTPEVSGKNKGSAYELAVASRMMFLAKNRKSIPKNLGIDLILFKDKRKHEKVKEKIEVPIIEAQGGIEFIQDKAGSFKILVEDDKIKVIHYKNMEPQIALVSDNAKKLYEEIIKKNLVTRLEHAAYLGAELQKAEIALVTGKDYRQDLELFRKPFKL
jgi:dihydropteroate synthase-like protein